LVRRRFGVIRSALRPRLNRHAGFVTGKRFAPDKARLALLGSVGASGKGLRRQHARQRECRNKKLLYPIQFNTPSGGHRSPWFQKNGSLHATLPAISLTNQNLDDARIRRRKGSMYCPRWHPCAGRAKA
jgi:hypothetical protein